MLSLVSRCRSVVLFDGIWQEHPLADFNRKKGTGDHLQHPTCEKSPPKFPGKEPVSILRAKPTFFCLANIGFLGVLGKTKKHPAKKVPNFPIKHFEASDYSTREP
jgi:hypothetical protein